MSSNFDIWVSNNYKYLTVTPVDRGYDDMDELLSLMEADGYDIYGIERDDGEFWFPLNLRKR